MGTGELLVGRHTGELRVHYELKERYKRDGNLEMGDLKTREMDLKLDYFLKIPPRQLKLLSNTYKNNMLSDKLCLY